MQDRGIVEYFRWLFFIDRAVSLSVFNLVVTTVLIWGYTSVYIIFNYFPQFHLATEQVLWVLGLYFVVVSFGFCLACKSDKPLFSFIGYNCMTIGSALFFSYFIPPFGIPIISQTIGFIAVVSLLMMLMLTKFTAVFESFSAMLFMVMSCVAITEFGWFVFEGEFKSIWHFVGAFMFCAFVGYQWKQYNTKFETLDKAIDFGAGLYVEIVLAIFRVLAELNAKRT
ncbi:hypothetical protein [Shewanella goraebulensis]|uniref:hypothetical protein n=1 Tax=Shewanella goraebulensis TaxID=3050637 RepID=UPI00254A4376|nr:hypothetical protein [Shewanella goraebulensis]